MQAAPAITPVGMARARVSQLKQMKELEQEQEVLLQGLEMMARGREWYQQQLQRVQERQRRLGQSRASAVSDAVQGQAAPQPQAEWPSPNTHSDRPPKPGHPQLGTVAVPPPRMLGHAPPRDIPHLLRHPWAPSAQSSDFPPARGGPPSRHWG